MKKRLALLVVLFLVTNAPLTIGAPHAIEKGFACALFPRLFEPLNTPFSLDTCDNCAAMSFAVYNECLNAHPGQECACGDVMVAYCFNHCSPCRFCADTVKQLNTYCL